MKKLLFALTATAAMAVAANAYAADKFKACWVYTGPIGDFGYSYQHEQGRQEVIKELGDKVDTAYLENVNEGPDAERAFERLAREHCNLIFGTSFGFMDAELKVAKRFPKVMFEHATGFKTNKNMGIYNARFYEGRYVMGQIAAKMSKTGVAGYIVSFPIPARRRTRARRCSTRAQTSSPRTRIRPRRCKSRKSAASLASGNRPT